VAGPGIQRQREIQAALLDFHRAPGRHMLALRQPALLFASVRDVLQLAGERSPDDDGPAPAPAIVQAARFFIRTALLQPGAGHYALLGLTTSADAAAVKDRYRSMMRLMHPDFATGRADWPADAATRINQAYEVLSSPERRRAYDDELTAAPAESTARVSREIAKAQPAPRRAAQPRRGDSRTVLRRLALGFGGLGAVALAAMWLASGDRDSLVQRATTKVSEAPSLLGKSSSDNAAPDQGLSAVIARALPSMLATPTLPGASNRAPEPPAAAPSPAPVAEAAAPAKPASEPAVTSTVFATTPVLAPGPATPPPAAAAVPVIAASTALAPAAQAAAVAAPVRRVPLLASAAAARAAPSVPTGLSMAEVHPLVMQLLQEIESGWGDNLIATLDFGARRTPGAQALARQLDTLCEGVRPVKIAKVDLKGEPRDGQLVVTGQVVLQVRDSSTPTRRFALQAEFSQRDGAPVLTRLAPVLAQ
jgi:DnaJ-domain-containing protein 1